MNVLGELIGRSFERLLRWVYPGVLFAALMGFGKPTYFNWWISLPNERFLVAATLIIVTSFMIYSLQRFVWNEILIWILDRIGWSAFSQPPRTISYVDRLSQSIQRRFGFETDTNDRVAEKFADYLVNRWSAIHAMAATFWVFVVTWCWADGESLLIQWQDYLWLVAAVSLGASVLGAIVLERIEYQYFQSTPASRATWRWLG